MLTVTFPGGFVGRPRQLFSSLRGAAGTRVGSLHPYLSQRHERTETGKETSGDSRNVENPISYL